mmetsp:Transcript_1690/g.7380  ORF Transcript_1690/g.7380 Transcript_1690/m.7380 type:complete len:315 (-) Transcript_1690:170-1114(-)
MLGGGLGGVGKRKWSCRSFVKIIQAGATHGQGGGGRAASVADGGHGRLRGLDALPYVLEDRPASLVSVRGGVSLFSGVVHHRSLELALAESTTVAVSSGEAHGGPAVKEAADPEAFEAGTVHAVQSALSGPQAALEEALEAHVLALDVLTAVAVGLAALPVARVHFLARRVEKHAVALLQAGRPVAFIAAAIVVVLDASAIPLVVAVLSVIADSAAGGVVLDAVAVALVGHEHAGEDHRSVAEEELSPALLHVLLPLAGVAGAVEEYHRAEALPAVPSGAELAFISLNTTCWQALNGGGSRDEAQDGTEGQSSE